MLGTINGTLAVYRNNAGTSEGRMNYGQPKLKFNLRSQPDKAGFHQLQVRIYYLGKDVKKGLGTKVKPEFWDASIEQVRSKGNDASHTNMIINYLKNHASNIHLKYTVNNKALTLDSLIGELFKKQSDSCFIAFYREDIEKRRTAKADGITDSTYEHHKSILRKLEKLYPKGLPFESIDEAFFRRLKEWLLKTGNKNNTANNTLKRISTYLKRAKAKGHEVNCLPELLKEQKPKIDFLHKAELSRLHHYYLNTDNFEHREILRMFLFCCETGIRFGDAIKLKRANVMNHHLVFTPVKTQKTLASVSIFLTNNARELIKGKDALLFNCSKSNVVHNRYLKDIAAICLIKKKLHFHMSRHTFAVRFLDSGGSVEVLMQLLGHAKINTTMVYVHVSDKRRDEQMKLLNK